MTLKLLGAADLAADTVTLLYQVPEDRHAFVAVNLCCRSGGTQVRVAVADDDPGDGDWIEYGVPLLAGGAPLLREGLMLAAGEGVYVHAADAGVSATAWGSEETA